MTSGIMIRDCIALMVAITVSAITTARAETPVERGAYLVNTIMTCNNCHTPMGPNGPQFDKALSGGLTFDEPPFKVTASNITPDKETGIGTWSDADIKRTLRTGVRPNGVALAAVMPSGFYGIITDGDMDAIVAYLRSIKLVSNKVPDPVYHMALPHEVFPGSEKPLAWNATPRWARPGTTSPASSAPAAGNFPAPGVNRRRATSPLTPTRA
jgi:mono/diheme cytochrome c family protein